MRKLLATFGVLAALVASSASAQTNAAPTGKSAVLSIQPLIAMFTVYSGEGELAISPSVTLGAGGTYWDSGTIGGENLKYVSGDLKLRYYPEGHALQGFSFGGSVGVTRVSESVNDSSATTPTIGVLLEYGWLLGTQRNFYIGVGLGAKRLFVKNPDEFGGDFSVGYPTARVSVGVAF